MSFNGSGTFVINTAGQPVVANTVISATVFNALTADLATGLSTCITKDGQTTITANIPFGSNKITGLGAATAATDAATLGQVQSTAAKLITVTGTDTITGTMSPALTAYAAGQLFYFIANAANTGAMTINIDGLGAKAITRDGSTALIAGDVNTGEIVVICYDGTRFQMINAANSFGNTTINGTLTVTGNTGLQANVSITSTLSVGGTFAVTGAATLGSTLSVTGKSDLPVVSTASMNAAVAVITTGTVTNLTSTSASIASMNAGVALLTNATVTTLTATGASIASANIGNLQFTATSIASINAGVAVITNLTATGASIASMNAGVALLTTATVTNLTATGASIASANAGNLQVTGASVASANVGVALITTGTVTALTATGASIGSANVGTAVVTGLTVTNASIASANAGTATLSGNLTLNGGTANGVLYLNGSKVATSGSAVTYDGTTFATTGAANFATSSGNVGIGNTTGLSGKLGVSGNFSLSGAGTGSRYVALLDETASYAGTLNLQAGGGSAGFGGGIAMYGHSHATYPGATWIGYSSGSSTGILFGIGGNGVGSELMRLTSTGLGIGTSSPVANFKLTTSLSYDGSGGLYVENTSTGTSASSITRYKNSGTTFAFTGIGGTSRASYAGLGANVLAMYTDNTAGIALTVDAAGPITFNTNATTRATLDAAGNLGIGTSSPSQKLHVYQALTNSTAYGIFENNRSRNAAVLTKTTNGGFYTGTSVGTDTLCWQVYDETNGERLRIDSSGNLGLGVTPSAWGTFIGFDINSSTNPGAISSGGTMALGSNCYYNGANWIYKNSSLAPSLFQQQSGAHQFYTAASGTAGNAITFTQAMTLDASGNLGVGSTSPAQSWTGDPARILQVQGSTQVSVVRINSSGGSYGDLQLASSSSSEVGIYNFANGAMRFGTNNTERARITAGGDLLVGTTTLDVITANTTGFSVDGGNIGLIRNTVSGQPCYVANRKTDDGDLVRFCQDGTQEGTISVSGNTVSYNAFAGSHWSQLQDGSKPDILRGTVMESINELCVWPNEQNERLPKSKISDTAGSKKVYGVFMAWDNDWTETNDMYVTAVGAFICRVNGSVTVQEGDLLESNGDGTARVQADDIIRSSTIGKVTSTVKTHEYYDGSYCVPTVLYCG